ncbi:hypothetical protein QOZ94_001331 [Xanthobacter agilis]|uniref:Uncharacterized protein n=1 Tax=Xanthobacter agilis TaxID=47492 RepID=A0ABU0LBT0_XANAG|nr:hypothetical protein [Xanthobacter agilis]
MHRTGLPVARPRIDARTHPNFTQEIPVACIFRLRRCLRLWYRNVLSRYFIIFRAANMTLVLVSGSVGT